MCSVSFAVVAIKLRQFFFISWFTDHQTQIFAFQKKRILCLSCFYFLGYKKIQNFAVLQSYTVKITVFFSRFFFLSDPNFFKESPVCISIIIKSLDPLKAKKTFVRKKLGHTAVSAIKASSVTL